MGMKCRLMDVHAGFLIILKVGCLMNLLFRFTLRPCLWMGDMCVLLLF